MRHTLCDLALMVDHTNLRADATEADLRRLCGEARSHGFRMVAVNSVQSRLCAALLAGSDVHVGAAVSFPLGQTSVAAKVFETRDAIEHGADEVDYVVNLTEVKAGNWGYVTDEMSRVVEVCREAGVTSKVIFENCLLTRDEKIRLCEVASEVLPSFVKTSTGFSTGGATVEDVRLMRGRVDARVGVKAAGRIRSAQTFLSMVGAGAARVGATRSVTVIEELRALMEEAGTDYLEV